MRTTHLLFRRGSSGATVLDPAPIMLSPPAAPAAEPEPSAAPPMEDAVVAKPTPVRLVSLDVFRGLTILGMLLVNNISLGAHTPAQLMHAEWSGAVHFADLVFPWFLFIVGVAIPYAAASARRKHLPTWQFDLKALQRAGTLVLLGCLLDSALAGHPVFGLGVLQIIGLAYAMTVLVGGLLPLRGRLALAGALLLGHSALVHLGSAPGHVVGHLTEQDNFIDAVNKVYLAPLHIKGMLSVIPTTAMVLIGTAVGDLVRRKKISPLGKFGVLEVCGAGLIAAGLLWGHVLPMNKPLWTAPYILYTAGWGCAVLGVMYALIDAPRSRIGARASFPLLVFGTNAIVAYCLPILTKALILRHIPVAGPHGGKAINAEEAIQQWFYLHCGRIPGGWAYTIAYIAFWWLVLLFFYRKRWFLRV